jgi:hypothetical protein
MWLPAAGAGVAAVEHELLGAQSRLPRLFVQRRRVADQIVQSCAGRQVHLDHARIGVTLN